MRFMTTFSSAVRAANGHATGLLKEQCSLELHSLLSAVGTPSSKIGMHVVESILKASCRRENAGGKTGRSQEQLHSHGATYVTLPADSQFATCVSAFLAYVAHLPGGCGNMCLTGVGSVRPNLSNAETFLVFPDNLGRMFRIFVANGLLVGHAAAWTQAAGSATTAARRWQKA
eukprot:6199074-Pleurochrysis_carterae.AAC.1